MGIKRVFIVSSKQGWIGLGPENTQVGDSICIVEGYDTPLLLRSRPDGNFTFVRECYIIDNEAWIPAFGIREESIQID